MVLVGLGLGWAWLVGLGLGWAWVGSGQTGPGLGWAWFRKFGPDPKWFEIFKKWIPDNFPIISDNFDPDNSDNLTVW